MQAPRARTRGRADAVPDHAAAPSGLGRRARLGGPNRLGDAGDRLVDGDELLVAAQLLDLVAVLDLEDHEVLDQIEQVAAIVLLKRNIEEGDEAEAEPTASSKSSVGSSTRPASTSG